LLRVLEGRERILGADYTLTLETVSSLGNIYRLQGKPLPGVEMIRASVWTQSQVDTSCGQRSGPSLQRKLRANSGRRDFLGAFRGYEQAFGTNLRLEFEMINNLGSFYVNQGKQDELEEVYKRMLERCENLFDSDRSCCHDLR
jgi:hypothetical protein